MLVVGNYRCGLCVARRTTSLLSGGGLVCCWRVKAIEVDLIGIPLARTRVFARVYNPPLAKRMMPDIPLFWLVGILVAAIGGM